MAFTNKGDIQPIRPWSGIGGASVIYPVAFPVAAAQTVSVGDCMVLTSGKAVVDNTDALPAGTVIGFALEAKAAIASPTDRDLVLIAPALPGAIFLGTAVGGAATDKIDPTYAQLAPGTPYDLVEESDTGLGIACINFADTTGGSFRVFKYAEEQSRGQNFTSGTGGTICPKVLFTVVQSQTIWS